MTDHSVTEGWEIEVRQGSVTVDYVALVYCSKQALIFHIATKEKYTRLLATGSGDGGRKIMIGEDVDDSDYGRAAAVTVKGIGGFDVEAAETQRYRVIWTLCRSEKAKNVWVKPEGE